MFLTYSKSVGLIISIVVLFLAFCAEGSIIGSRMWLAKWSSGTNISESKRDMYLGIYGAIGAGQGFFVLMEVLLLTYGCITASRVLHDRLLQNILRCPMSFFETTPIGRIVNRFSKDINLIDEKIPKSSKQFISTFMTMLGTVFVISFATPLFLSVLVPIAFVYILTQVFFYSLLFIIILFNYYSSISLEIFIFLRISKSWNII